jgi:aspartyl-tRNA(Asn)/glutamyl-tRNA(Gln) amidotransferase subunit B
MEKGIMRFEANVSVRPRGSDLLGTRTEIKNLNSFRSLTHGVAYEIERQSRLLDEGKSVKQETLGWDDTRSETYSQRSKEEECDYRYFPEPDLPPLILDPTYISQIKASLPELPDDKQARFTHDYHLSPYIASVLTSEREVADYFEIAVAAVPSLSPVTISKWLSGEFFALLHHSGQSIEETRIEPAAFAQLVALVSNDTISASSGKAVLSEMFESGKSPEKIVAARELAQISEPSEIDSLVSHILESNPSQVSQYLDGKITIQDWFFGQVMRETQGRANPAAVRSCLEMQLKELKDNQSSE